MNFDILGCRSYDFAQKYYQVRTSSHIGLYISGLRYYKTQYSTFDHNSGPAMNFSFAGEYSDFDFGPDRENWVLQYQSDNIYPDKQDPATIILNWGQQQVSLPRSTLLKPDEIDIWRSEFSQMSILMKKPDDAAVFLCKSHFIKILAMLIERHGQVIDQSPIAMFKRLLDDIENAATPLEELSKRCGYCAHYIRRLFNEKYGISPNAYRQQKRLEYCLNLLKNTNLSCKEIAQMAGFEHASHFTNCFKKMYKVSPYKAKFC